MEWLSAAMEFINGPAFVGLIGGLFMISEALAIIPAVKANSVFQAIFNGLSALKAKVAPKV